MEVFFKKFNKRRGGFASGFTPTLKIFGVSLRSKRGFTLVESLVAISIFSVSIVALMVALGQGISDTGQAKKKEIAAYLAQEGIEYVRNMRDTFVLYDAGGAQTGWTNFTSNLIDASACQSANGCYINADSLNYSDNTQPMIDINPIACSGSTCSNGALLYNSSTGKYGFSGITSGYTRKIWITPASPINEVKVFSRVSWTQGSGNYSLTFSENLFNWIE